MAVKNLRPCSNVLIKYCGTEYFSMELVLRVNLGPLHLLDPLIEEILLQDPKTYLRKETRISQIVSKDINKSSAIATFQKNTEKKSRFPTAFWLTSSFK